MKLTSRQLRFVRRLLDYQDRPPSLSRFLGRLVIMLSVWALVLGGLTLMYSGSERHGMFYLSGGILTGFLGANLATMRMARSNWPVYKAVIDWSKLKALEDEADGPAGH